MAEAAKIVEPEVTTPQASPTSMTSSGRLADLMKALETFSAARSILRRLYDNYSEFFERRYYPTLRRQEVDEEQVPEEQVPVFLTEDDMERLEKIMKKEPSVIITGQMNCGKTSLVNELLGGDYLPTKKIPNTARQVSIRYAKHNSIKVISPEGEVLEERTFEDKIPPEIISLEQITREEDQQVRVKVEVGINHPLLEKGLVIVDIPGLSENDVLDNLIMSCLDGVLQIIVYVINGKDQLREQDQAFLTKINAQAPTVDIIYVCNKVEFDKKAAAIDQDSGSEDQDIREAEKEREKLLARSKEINMARSTFTRLQSCDLLPADASYHDSNDYHALSCRKVRSARSLRKSATKNEYYCNQFDKFVLGLQERVIKCIYSQIRPITIAIRNAQKLFLDILDRDEVTTMVAAKRAMLIVLGSNASNYYEQFKKRVDSDLSPMISDTFSICLDKESFCEVASRMEIRARKPFERRSDYLNSCRSVIRNRVITSILHVISQVLDNISPILRGIASETVKAISFTNLDASLPFNYHSISLSYNKEIESVDDTDDDDWFDLMKAKAGIEVLKLVEGITSTHGGSVDPQWRRATAEDYLTNIDVFKLTELILTTVTDRMEHVHRNVVDMIFRIEQLLCIEETEHGFHEFEDIIPDLSYDWHLSLALLSTITTGGRVESTGPLIHCSSNSDVYDYRADKSLVVKKFKHVSTMKEVCLKHAQICESTHGLCLRSGTKTNQLYLNVSVAFDQNWNIVFLEPRMKGSLEEYLKDSMDLTPHVALLSVLRLIRSVIQLKSRDLECLHVEPNTFLVDSNETNFVLVYNWVKKPKSITVVESISVKLTKLIAYLIIHKSSRNFNFDQTSVQFYNQLDSLFQINSEFDLAMKSMFQKHLCDGCELETLRTDVEKLSETNRVTVEY